MLTAIIFIIRKSVRVGLPITLSIICFIWLPLWWTGFGFPHDVVKYLAVLVTLSPPAVMSIWLSITWDHRQSERKSIDAALTRLKEHRFKHKQLKAAPPKAGSEPPAVY